MTSPYRCFDVTLAGRERLSESFVRITLRGDDLDKCSPTLLDQRVKLALGESRLLDPFIGKHWYTAWTNAVEKPVLRTYTLSDVRPQTGEVDVDVVLHGAPGDGAGPASAFAQSADLGTRLLLVAADIDVEGHEDSGVAYHPGAASRVVLVADATALPAVANILAQRREGVRYEALIEVPHISDIRELDADRITWRVTDRGESVLDTPPFATPATPAATPAADTAAKPNVMPDADTAAKPNAMPDADTAAKPNAMPDADSNTDDDGALLWDEAEGADGGTYLWVAGEAAMVRAVRSVAKQAGFDRTSASFMGYWRAGRASD